MKTNMLTTMPTEALILPSVVVSLSSSKTESTPYLERMMTNKMTITIVATIILN
jgi:hypothetical protein